MSEVASRVVQRPRRSPRSWLWGGVGGLLLVAAPAVATGAAAVPAPGPAPDLLMMTGTQPLAAGELAELRGGLFTPGGLEITFGLRFEVDIHDELRLVTRFTPRQHGEGTGKWSWADFEPGEFELAYKGGESAPKLTRGTDGEVSSVGATHVQDIPGGKRYEFDGGLVAEVLETKNGFVLTTSGELPVHLKQSGKGVELEVGDKTTTLVEGRLDAKQLLARLANRRDGAAASHSTILDLNLMNYSDLAAAYRPVAHARRLQHLVNGSLLSYGMRR